ncbi:TetR/AcrR family transcriptional regulator [Amycolatopsis pigmentata]|uniref:TetR/AcrR family transcriptional regulator n=1 Tax=Amycolatopsis pigmentata TaxID=450801 RepID=A0ABW5FYI8_9PSEU
MRHEVNERARPLRGTRPRNRRALIIAAATELFYEHGYDLVGMSDLAEAVEIGPSALYRHFSGKQELLREVVLDGLRAFRQLLAELDLADRDHAVPTLARLALDHRELGVLWQRETRNLTPEARSELREEVLRIDATLARLVRLARPEVSAAAAKVIMSSFTAVLISPSFHRIELPRGEHEAVLAVLANAVLDSPVPHIGPVPRTPEPSLPPILPRSRREALLTLAIRLFSQQGYARVGIEDIAAAAGTSGPSVYAHFPTKIDMLVTAIDRGNAALLMDLSRACTTATGPSEALSGLIGGYTRVALAHYDLIGLLVTEIRQLPDDDRHKARRAQHEYVAEWTQLLRDLRPELEPAAARTHVHAALSVINMTARVPWLRATPGIAEAVETICGRLLG